MDFANNLTLSFLSLSAVAEHSVSSWNETCLLRGADSYKFYSTAHHSTCMNYEVTVTITKKRHTGGEHVVKRQVVRVIYGVYGLVKKKKTSHMLTIDI